jgi:hypothetical protein
MSRRFHLLLPLLALILGGCAQPSYVYHYVPGKTADLHSGIAFAPPEAPLDVKAAIAAGNRIAGLPYVYGAGHGRDIDTAYDCSGAASFVLRGAGRLDESTVSSAFRHYGSSGEGDWITVYAKNGHVFLVVAGLRFDTGWTHSGVKGPQWTKENRSADYCVLRHPSGL